MLANNRFLTYIFFSMIIILKFVTMFLLVNIRKNIVDSILTFIVNEIFGGSHLGLFPLNGHSFRSAWGTSVGESFPVKLLAVCLLFWWRRAPSRGVFKYFDYYYYYHYFR